MVNTYIAIDQLWSVDTVMTSPFTVDGPLVMCFACDITVKVAAKIEAKFGVTGRVRVRGRIPTRPGAASLLPDSF